MSEAKAPEDATAWHRRFAVASNNRAWDLSVQNRSSSEDQEMLNVAHASAWHWSIVGTELNRMRATMLLAEVHALLGFGKSNEEERRNVASTFSRVPEP
jgi:hypothetical protein